MLTDTGTNSLHYWRSVECWEYSQPWINGDFCFIYACFHTHWTDYGIVFGKSNTIFGLKRNYKHIKCYIDDMTDIFFYYNFKKNNIVSFSSWFCIFFSHTESCDCTNSAIITTMRHTICTCTHYTFFLPREYFIKFSIAYFVPPLSTHVYVCLRSQAIAGCPSSCGMHAHASP